MTASQHRALSVGKLASLGCYLGAFLMVVTHRSTKSVPGAVE
jgi:hypothetical protein